MPIQTTAINSAGQTASSIFGSQATMPSPQMHISNTPIQSDMVHRWKYIAVYTSGAENGFIGVIHDAVNSAIPEVKTAGKVNQIDRDMLSIQQGVVLDCLISVECNSNGSKSNGSKFDHFIGVVFNMADNIIVGLAPEYKKPGTCSSTFYIPVGKLDHNGEFSFDSTHIFDFLNAIQL